MNPVGDAVAIVAYAELRAIMLGWAGCSGWDPITRAWAATRNAVKAPSRAGVVAVAQRLLRDDTRLLLDSAIRRAGPWPFDRTVGPGQIGALVGIEAIFHDAACSAIAHRADDRRVLSTAIGLADLIHSVRSRQP